MILYLPNLPNIESYGSKLYKYGILPGKKNNTHTPASAERGASKSRVAVVAVKSVSTRCAVVDAVYEEVQIRIILEICSTYGIYLRNMNYVV